MLALGAVNIEGRLRYGFLDVSFDIFSQASIHSLIWQGLFNPVCPLCAHPMESIINVVIWRRTISGDTHGAE